MGNRLDVVLVDGEDIRIHHQRWGASALFDMLQAGPRRAWEIARDSFPRAAALSDALATCLIDRGRRVLVIGGPARAITAAGALRPPEPRLLAELAVAWPGWRLAYEPTHALAAVLAHVHGLGLPLASPAPPAARFTACAYALDVPPDPEAAVDIPVAAPRPPRRRLARA